MLLESLTVKVTSAPRTGLAATADALNCYSHCNAQNDQKLIACACKHHAPHDLVAPYVPTASLDSW